MNDVSPEALEALLQPLENGGIQEPALRKKEAQWQPGIRWDGTKGEVTTDAIAGTDRPDWSEVLSVFELNPDEYDVVEPVLFNAWHGSTSQGKELFRQWKARIIRKVHGSTVDVQDLIDEIKKHKPRKPLEIDGDGAFCVVLADWQTGKPDGDGLKGTVGRILQAIDDVEHRVKELRRLKRPIGRLVIVWTGDSVEGCIGHYDMQTFGVELDRRSQVKVARRLLRDALIRWSRHFDDVLVIAVGGNHGENRKDGKAYTTLGDNDDLAIVEQVAEILASNPEAYGHVKFAIPNDHLTMTAEVAGWILGVTHGHVARESGTAEQKLRRWYERMAAARISVGQSDVLVTGHYHHLRMADWGSCVWLQAPAMDGGSEWWRLMRGENANPGVLTFAMYPHVKVADVAIL